MLADFDFCKHLTNSGMKYVDISMKGKDAKEWIKETGADGCVKQAQAIHNLSNLAMEFTCSMVVTPENVYSVCERVQCAHDCGARQFSFTFFIDNDDALEKGITYLEKHNPYVLIDAFLAQADHLSAISDDWWVEYSFPMCIYTDEQIALLKGRLAAPCHIFTKDAIVFNPDMEILPCDMYSKTKMGKFGGDFSSYEEFRKIAESQAYRSVLDSLSRHPSTECVSCHHLKSCQGGCPVLWKNYSFDDLKKFKESRASQMS